MILAMYCTEVLVGIQYQHLASNRPKEKLLPLAKLIGDTWLCPLWSGY